MQTTNTSKENIFAWFDECNRLKGIVQPNIKILLLFTAPHVTQDFISSDKHKQFMLYVSQHGKAPESNPNDSSSLMSSQMKYVCERTWVFFWAYVETGTLHIYVNLQITRYIQIRSNLIGYCLSDDETFY